MDTTTAIALSRLTAQQRSLEVTADNLANANTPGYRTEHVLFSDWLSRQGGSNSGGAEATIAYTQDRATWRDTLPGPLTHTGDPLDLAITGGGFFTVSTPTGPRLTRAGHFGLLPDGTVADDSGHSLLDTNGRPIQLSPADSIVTIAGDGTISSENGQLARIGVVEVDDPARLTAEGTTLARADGTTRAATGSRVVEGAVEESNVKPVLELTRMMTELREFQFTTQLVQSEAERQQSAIDKLLTQRGG